MVKSANKILRQTKELVSKQAPQHLMLNIL